MARLRRAAAVEHPGERRMNTTTDSIRSACTAQTIYTSPLGPLLLARTERGLAGAWFDGQKHHPRAARRTASRRRPAADPRGEQLHAYFAGARRRLRRAARPARHAVPARGLAARCCAIAPGATRSYGEIAQRARRAVARCARSARRSAAIRSSVIVPCHRVVGSDGSLTGYAGGVERKRALLRTRRRASATSGPAALEG